MKITIIVEKATDGSFSCYMKEDIPSVGLFGYGDTAEDAKNDLLESYKEIKEMNISVPELDFTFQYDLQSFFDYFNMINVSKLAEKAGINASLLRQYRIGKKKASENQYLKLKECVHSLGDDLLRATF